MALFALMCFLSQRLEDSDIVLYFIPAFHFSNGIPRTVAGIRVIYRNYPNSFGIFDLFIRLFLVA